MENSITCPNCKNEINVNEVLYQQLQGQIKKEYEAKAAIKEKEIQAQLKEIEQAQATINQEKEKMNEVIEAELAKKLRSEKLKLEASIKSKIKEETDDQFQQIQKELKEKTDQVKELNKTKAEIERLKREKEEVATQVASEKEKEFTLRLKKEKAEVESSVKKKFSEETSEQLRSLEAELAEKSSQIKELNKTRAEVERLKREKEELKESILLEKEKEFNEKLKQEQSRIKQQAEESNAFKIKEREKIINDLKTQLDDAKRKAEQGSIQLQGEVQEMEIQKMLLQLYPMDEIIEIKKGQRGADILQDVRNQSGVSCGKIYYESKRTKNFDNAWLQKLRDDNMEAKADILVLVTEAMPAGVERFIQKDKVWICSYKDVKGLSYVLRYAIMETHSVAVTQHGKESKMEMLYNFLTSQEFKAQFEAIIEGFANLRDSHNSEKMKMQRMWKEREKNMEKVLLNTVNLYGSLKGIAGSSIPNIKLLEDNTGNDQIES